MNNECTSIPNKSSVEVTEQSANLLALTIIELGKIANNDKLFIERLAEELQCKRNRLEEMEAKAKEFQNKYLELDKSHLELKAEMESQYFRHEKEQKKSKLAYEKLLKKANKIAQIARKQTVELAKFKSDSQ